MATTNGITASASKRQSSNSRRLILLLLTSGFFITGLLFDYMPMIVDNQIKRTVELATNDEIQSIWSRPPVDFHSYYWLYDILNAEKFITGEEKVRVRRVGPYHFTARMEKRILDVSPNKYRISYNSTRHIYADELNSVSLDEPLVLLNPVYASLVTGAREMTRDQEAQSRQMMLSSVGRMAERFNETLFINTTARSALIGRRLLIVDKLLKMAETFGFEVDLPSIARNKLFGYVAAMNGTWDGPFEVYSGYQASMNSLGDVISYQGRKRLREFQGKCNRLQASAGELRPMPIHENLTLEMFQPRFCRIVHLQPTGTRKLKEGLAISYELSHDDFMSGQANADNRCFCLNNTSNSYCSLNGAVEVGPCSYHSPIVVTASSIKPDERITGSVMNWDPDMMHGDVELLPKGDDRGQILILKRLGVPVQGDITLTLFMRVTRDPTFRQTSQVPEESFIPILTVRERGQIPPKLGQIIVNLESFLSLTTHLKVVMYLTAVVLLCSLTGHYYTKSSIQAAGPRITPSGGTADGNDDADNDQGSEQPRSGKRTSSSTGGARMMRGSRVALPASGAPSDRANSADSNRSQPPSRVSHSSLDVPSGDEQTGGSGADGGPHQRTSGASSGQQTSDQQQSRPRVKTAKAGGQHRIFSKVDEEASLRSDSWRAKRQANLGEPKRPTDTSGATNGLVGSSSSSSWSQSAATGLQRPASGQLATETASKRQPTNKRNWFMKVCSNFVRMLNGIRSSINDAGQLDINENDYQDKQLEMLAGKIDSWYQSSPVTPDSSLPTSSAGIGNGNGNDDGDGKGTGGERASAISGEPKLGSGKERVVEQQQQQRSSGAAGSGKQEMKEEGKSEIDGRSQQRINKEDEDAGVGSEGEETPRHRSMAEGSPQPATTVDAARSTAPGPKPSAAPQIPVEKWAWPADRADQSAEAAIDAGARESKNVPSLASARRSDKKLAADGIGAQEEEDAAEGGQLAPSMEQNEERRDSIQSNETVINKRGQNEADSVDDKRRAKSPSANNYNNMRDEKLAKVEPSEGRKEATLVLAASAAGESNNQLVQDKRAALESVELALSAANRIESF